MARRTATTKILMYGMSQGLVSWYENILEFATCPVEIVFECDDDPVWISKLPRKCGRPITCWQRTIRDRESENHFLLFGSNTLLFDTRGDGNVWLANFNEQTDIGKLKDRFERYLKESSLRPVDLLQTVLS